MRGVLTAALVAALTGDAVAQRSDFRTWLERDAAYLITAAEREAFGRLTRDDDRARFIADFWRLRDPTPATDANELYHEHMRRLDESERFASGVAGWRTDRGRVYITWGPPDFIESNPAGVRGGVLGALSDAPELATETWTYENLPGRRFGTGRAQIAFVDRGGGDYRLLTDPRDANLAFVYGLSTAANPLQYESAAYVDPATGLSRTDGTAAFDRSQVLGPETPGAADAQRLDRIHVAADISRSRGDVLEDIARSQRARGLKQEVRARLFTRRFPVSIDVAVFDTDDDQAYCPIAVAIPGSALSFQRSDRHHATAVVHGEVRDERSGRVVREFTEAIKFRLTDETYARGLVHGFSYHRAMSLPPGRYRVDLAVKDEIGDAVGLASTVVDVAARTAAGLRLSPLLLSEEPRRPVPTTEATAFTLGRVSVAPRADRRFRPDERIHVVYQASGLHRSGELPPLTADYTLLRGDQIVRQSALLTLDRRVAANGGRQTGRWSVLLSHVLDLTGLEAGDYVVQVKVIDHEAQRHVIARTVFSVTAAAP